MPSEKPSGSTTLFDSLSLQDTAAYWKLAAEIAEAKDDKVLQAKCLKKQLACLK